MEVRDPLRHHVKSVRADLEGTLAATSSSLGSQERRMYVEPSVSLLSNNYRPFGKTLVGAIHPSHGLSGYEGIGEGVREEEDDEGLYLALSSMPVKVEIEEEGDNEVKTDDYDVSHRNDLTDLSRNETDLGIADASSSWYHNPHPSLMGSTILSPSQLSCTFLGNTSDNDRELQKKLQAQERAKKYRESLTPEQLEALRERNRERAKRRRMMMTEEELFMERVKNRESAQVRRMSTPKETGGSREGNGSSECLDTEERKVLTTREKNRDRMRLKRQNMSEEEKNVERQKNRERVRKRRQLLKAESLLKKLLDARNDMIKISPLEDPKNITVQNLVTTPNGCEETVPHISGEFK